MALTKEQKKYLKLSKTPEVFEVVISKGRGEEQIGVYRKFKTAISVAKKYEKDGSVGIRNKYGAFLNFQHNKTVEPGKTALLPKGRKNKSTKGNVSIHREYDSKTGDRAVISFGFPHGSKLRLLSARMSLEDLAKALTGLSGNAEVEAVFRR